MAGNLNPMQLLMLLKGGNPQQVYAAELSRRTRYCTRVVTNTTSGSFKLLGKLQCSQCSYNDITSQNNLPSLPVAEAAPGA